MRTLHRFRFAICIFQLIIAAIQRDLFLSPQFAYDLGRFVKPMNALGNGVKRDPVGIVFHFKPCSANPQDQATAAYVIESGSHLRENSRMSVCVSGHKNSRVNLRALNSERSETGAPFETGPGWIAQ